MDQDCKGRTDRCGCAPSGGRNAARNQPNGVRGNRNGERAARIYGCQARDKRDHSTPQNRIVADLIRPPLRHQIIWQMFGNRSYDCLELHGVAQKGRRRRGADLTSWASGFHSLADAFKMVEPRGVEPLTFSLRMVTMKPDIQ